MNISKYLFPIIFLLFTKGLQANNLPLEKIKEKLLNNEIVITGTIYESHLRGPRSLREWEWLESQNKALQRSNSFENSKVYENIRGTRGTVIAVVPVIHPSISAPRKDAFGNLIDPAKEEKPYIDIIVELANAEGKIKARGFYPTLASQAFRMASEQNILITQIDNDLSYLNGRKIFNHGRTKIYPASISLEDLQSRSSRDMARDWSIQNLTPMEIVDSKFSETANAVIIKVKLPDGGERILHGEIDAYQTKDHPSKERLERLGIEAAENIPKKFSKREIESIKSRSIFTGMSEEALYWSWGYPKTTNYYGQAGEQLVYESGQYVYLSGNKVRDFQKIR